MFAIFPVLRQGKSCHTASGKLRSDNSRDEKRHSSRVFVESCAVMLPEFHFFPAHDDWIKNSEINTEEHRRHPGVRGHRYSQSQKCAPQVQLIARASIRPGDRKDFVLVKVACRISAQPQTKKPDNTANHDAVRGWPRKPQDSDGKGITQSN